MLEIETKRMELVRSAVTGSERLTSLPAAVVAGITQVIKGLSTPFPRFVNRRSSQRLRLCFAQAGRSI